MRILFFLFLLLLFNVGTEAQNTLDILGLTSSTPAAAAYSLRKVSTAYSGNAIQVRRSNDNTTQGIGFTANGNLDTTSLKTFVTSNSAYVTIWYDQSGNGRNLTQANTSQQPAMVNAGVIYRRNSLPTVFHDAVNDGLAYGSNYLTSNPLSVNIVAGSYANSNAMRRAVQGTSNWLIGPYSNAHSWYANGWNHMIATPWSITSVEVFTVIQPSVNACTSWRNGITQATGNNKGCPNVINTGTIGAFAEPLNGFISEILVFNSELSDTDRNRIECNQGNYYSIAMGSNCPTTILTQPLGTTQTDCQNGSATPLTVIATGANVTYQWYRNTSSSNTGGTSITGATTNTYSPPTSSLGTTYYYVVVSGTYAPTTVTSSVSGAIIVLANPGLSNFTAVTRTYFDGSYVITAPTSSSAGAITYTSSNTAVATISGTTVTIVSAGTSTITATQAATGTYCSTSISALLTVNSVQVVTKSGEITITNPNYVSNSGSINSSRGLSAAGEIKVARTAGDGLTSATASASASQIKLDYPGSTDGVYWIDLPTVGPTQIYCIMNSAVDGGGWMLAMKATTATTFNYSANYWTTSNTLNPTDNTRNAGDAKYASMNNFQAKDMLALWPDIASNYGSSATGGSINLSATYNNWCWLQNNFNGGTRITPISFFATVNNLFFSDAALWAGRGTAFSSQTDVRFYGFNYTGNSSAKTRWGFGWNENGGGLYPNGNQATNDVSGGVGMDAAYGSYSAGDKPNCCQNTTGINRSARVEIYIR